MGCVVDGLGSLDGRFDSSTVAVFGELLGYFTHSLQFVFSTHALNSNECKHQLLMHLVTIQPTTLVVTQLTCCLFWVNLGPLVGVYSTFTSKICRKLNLHQKILIPVPYTSSLIC